MQADRSKRKESAETVYCRLSLSSADLDVGTEVIPCAPEGSISPFSASFAASSKVARLELALTSDGGGAMGGSKAVFVLERTGGRGK